MLSQRTRLAYYSRKSTCFRKFLQYLHSTVIFSNCPDRVFVHLLIPFILDVIDGSFCMWCLQHRPSHSSSYIGFRGLLCTRSWPNWWHLRVGPSCRKGAPLAPSAQGRIVAWFNRLRSVCQRVVSLAAPSLQSRCHVRLVCFLLRVRTCQDAAAMAEFSYAMTQIPLSLPFSPCMQATWLAFWRLRNARAAFLLKYQISPPSGVNNRT